jgi:hypothetical protein
MSIEESFGAEIKLTLPESNQRQLFLIRSSSPDVDLPALMRPRGGRIVLNGGAWIIAELGFDEATELRKMNGIAFVGGISLDPQRFAAFSKLTGFDPLRRK